MKSKTLISKQESRKTSEELVETIRDAKKHKNWLYVAGVLAGSRNNWKSLNLEQINKEIKEGEGIIVLGKVLSQGNLTKKAKVIAFGFSENAKDKLKNSGCEAIKIKDEIKKNPDAKGLRILK
mgnify:FL=1